MSAGKSAAVAPGALLRLVGAVGWVGVVVLVALAAGERVVVGRDLLTGLAAIGILLGLLLRQGRTVLAVLVVAATVLLIPAGGVAGGAEAWVLVTLGPMLLMLAVDTDVRPLGRRFGWRLLALAAIAGVVFLVSRRPEWDSLLAFDLLPWFASSAPAAAESSFGLAGVLALGLVLRRSEPSLRGALWSIVALVAWWQGAAVGALAAIVAWIVAALEGAHALAWRDGLTRLPSRRAFDRELAELPGSYALAMVDVDHFKRLNDRWGHDVGDQVLAMVAAEIGSTKGARAFRYGGEEFALVFRGRAAGLAAAALEDLRARIARRRFAVRTGATRSGKSQRGSGGGRATVPVTASIGWSQRSSRRGTPEVVLAAADRALYRAKGAGRNAVIGG